MMPIKNMLGEKSGRLTVVSFSHLKTGRGAYWICMCECGNAKTVRGDAIRKQTIRSCGCLHRESARQIGLQSKTHGQTGTPLYAVWAAMMRRCYNKNVRQFKYYGGRGIIVCTRWHSFENFAADMGQRPDGLTLDRIDCDGHYAPGNCRWATWKVQQNNRRNNVGASR